MWKIGVRCFWHRRSKGRLDETIFCKKSHVSNLHFRRLFHRFLVSPLLSFPLWCWYLGNRNISRLNFFVWLFVYRGFSQIYLKRGNLSRIKFVVRENFVTFGKKLAFVVEIWIWQWIQICQSKSQKHIPIKTFSLNLEQEIM